MKQKVFFLTVLFCVYFVQTIAQNLFFRGNNVLMPQNLIVEYVVRLDTNNYLFDERDKELLIHKYRKIYPEKNIFSIIYPAVLSGNVRCYQPYLHSFNAVSPNEIYKNPELISVSKIEINFGGGADTVIITDDGGSTTKEVIIRNIDTTDNAGLLFIEEWNVNETPFRFEKKVLAYSPVINVYRQDDIDSLQPIPKLVFSVIDTLTKTQDIERSNNRMVLVNKIAYEHFLYCSNLYPYTQDLNIRNTNNDNGMYYENQNSPFLTSYGICRLLNLMFENVLSGKMNAYDFFDSQKKLTHAEIETSLGQLSDTIFVMDPMSVPVVQIIIPQAINYYEFLSVIFLEKWYIDPKTLRMTKKVVGIAPVRYIDRDIDGNGDYRKSIPFVMFFDENDRF